MYWTQWKNRQLPLGDHKRNISLLPSTCDCLPRLSILHESLSTQPAKAGSLKSPQVSWHSHPHVTKFSQWPRPASSPEVLSGLWFFARSVWDRQDRTQTSSFTAAVQTILVPFSKLQIQLVTFLPFHWNSPTTTANPAGSPRCFLRPLLGCSNLEEFWTGHSLKMELCFGSSLERDRRLEPTHTASQADAVRVQKWL